MVLVKYIQVCNFYFKIIDPEKEKFIEFEDQPKYSKTKKKRGFSTKSNKMAETYLKASRDSNRPKPPNPLLRVLTILNLVELIQHL